MSSLTALSSSVFNANTLNALSLGMTASGITTSFMSARNEGKLEQGIYSAKATAARAKGDAIIASGKDAARMKLREARRLTKRNKTIMAATGGTMEGSNILVLAEDYANAEIDAQNTIKNAEQEAGVQYQQANIYGWLGKQAKKAGNIRAMNNVFQGVGSMLSTFALQRFSTASTTPRINTGDISTNMPSADKWVSSNNDIW